MSQPRAEAAFQQAVVDAARALGWLAYHTHDSRRSEPGFPDLVLCRERVIYAELKAPNGRLSPDQARWLVQLRTAGQEAYEWRPADWPEIEETLKRRVPAHRADITPVRRTRSGR